MYTDEGFLLHSEQKRRLGPVSLFSIVLSLCLPLTVFVIIPFSLASLAGPSTLIGVIAATVILLICVLHSSELSCSVPRSFCSLHIALASHGSLSALIISIIEGVDSLALAALLAKATAAHTNVLFRDLLKSVFEVHLGFTGTLSKWLFDDSIDLTCMIALLLAFILISGSLKVVGTVAFCLLLLSSLVVTSCSLVAFFHADPINWIDAPFFSAGLDGVLKSICVLIAGLRVPSLVVSLLDDTWQPRKRAPLVLPLLSFFSSLFSFLVALTFSLCINVSRVPDILLLPNVFHSLNVPAARYMLTVASVCGLWGALMSALLPGGRLILTVSGARLLPLSMINASPRRALCLFFCLLLAVLPLKNEHLMAIIALTTPLSMLITIALTISQHYGSRSIGLIKETSRYRRVKEPDQVRPMSDHSLSSITSSHGDSDGDSDYESLPLRAPAPFSASSYNEVAAATRHPRGLSTRHNCLAHQCNNNGDNVHLYTNEIPELPYYGAFVGGVQRSASDGLDTSDPSIGRRAMFLFFIHIVLTTVMGILSRGLVPISVSIILPCCLLISIGICVMGRTMMRLPQTALALSVHHRVPVFPISSLAAAFGLVFALSSTHWTTVAIVSVPVSIGAIVHVTFSIIDRSSSESPSSAPPPLVIVNLRAMQNDDEVIIGDDPSSIQ